MTVRISDVIVPVRFAPYVQTLTEQKSRLIQSGALVTSDFLNDFLAGGGDTITVPSWDDIDDDDSGTADAANTVRGVLADDVGNDDPASLGTYEKIQAFPQIAVRLQRNKQWRTMDMSAILAGSDPSEAIAQRVSTWWQRKLQAIFIATWNGVIAENATVPAGADTHVQNDLVFTAAGGFTATDFISAKTLLGDSMDDLSIVFMHSQIYSRALKNNLITFVQDSANPLAVNIPTFLGFEVVVDDGMPNDGTNYDTWLFGPGSSQLGTAPAKVPAEIERLPNIGNGAGGEALHSRQQYAIHPNGHAWTGSAASVGGPTNAELAAAGSFSRRTPERKQVKFVRLVSTAA